MKPSLVRYNKHIRTSVKDLAQQTFITIFKTNSCKKSRSNASIMLFCGVILYHTWKR